MGTSKTEIFTDRQNEMALFAKALGHPARIAIVEFLTRQDSCICGDVVSEIGLAQATVSQHLKELKNAGLINGNVEGTKVCYCLNKENWQKVESLFASMSQTVATSVNCC